MSWGNGGTMAWLRREAPRQAVHTRGLSGAEDEEAMRKTADDLRVMVEQVTSEEFRWQEANYDRDSLVGRELLYLAANNEWVRATAERVDVVRSDAIETEIKVDVDLDHITHEAFRQRNGQLWLPVVVLPPLKREGLPEPDPFVTLTVTDAAGNLLATLPNADVRHRISAAMAEIIINMAVAWWPDEGHVPTAARDQRLLLSAAIYRLLRREREAMPSENIQDKMSAPAGETREMTAPAQSAKEEKVGGALPRISHARRELLRLINVYSGLLSQSKPDGMGEAMGPTRPQAEAPGNRNEGAPTILFELRLTQRALLVLNALAVSTIVVVTMDRHDSPTVLTVQVPSRDLHDRPAKRSVRHPGTWWRPGTWKWVLPRAELEVDLLLPSADADRQVEVNLPAGVSFDPSQPPLRQAEMEITVRQPPLLKHLQQLMLQLRNAPENWPMPLYQCLADLAGIKAGAARELLRDHWVRPAATTTYPTLGELRTATGKFDSKLAQLRAELSRFSEGNCATARTHLEEIWGRLLADVGGASAVHLCRPAKRAGGCGAHWHDRRRIQAGVTRRGQATCTCRGDRRRVFLHRTVLGLDERPADNGSDSCPSAI